MSGGSMDYVGVRIEQAAEEVQDEISRILEDRDELGDSRFESSKYYKENYPDNPIFKNPNLLKEEVLRKMKDAVAYLKKAAIYAWRVEWLTSGDDGYESFVLSLDEELKKLKESRKESN